MPTPQLESDLPAATFSAVLSGFSQAQSAGDSPKKGNPRLVGAPLAAAAFAPRPSVAVPTSDVAPAAAVAPAAVIAPATVIASATDASTPVVARAFSAMPTPAVAPAPTAAPVVAPGASARADNTSQQITGSKTTSPAVAARVPISGLNAMKTSPREGAAPTAEPRPPEALSLHPSAFEQPASPFLGAGMHASTDGGRVGDAAPPSDSGKLPSQFQKADAPALEAPAGAAVTNLTASGSHPLAFAARLVERPETARADDDSPIQDLRAQAQTHSDAAVPPETTLPVLSGDGPEASPRTALPPLPHDPTQPASSATPPPAKPEDPHSLRTSVEVPASLPRREDADTQPSPPKVVRLDNAENLQAANPHGPAAAAGAPVAGLERPPTPARTDPSAPEQPSPATDRANATTHALSGSGLREPAAAGPAQNISVRLSSDGQPALEVRVMDRGGEVRVSVHSPDPATSESVRAGLPELVDRLGQRGYETEIWRPPAASSSARPQAESGGSFGRGGQQGPADQEQRHPQRQPRPDWLEELDHNLNPKTNRSVSSWRQ